MPPDFTGTLTGIPPMVPSANVQTGSSQAGPSGSGRRAAPQQGVAAVRAAVDQIRAMLASTAYALEFRADRDSGLVVVIVKDAETQEPVHQIRGSTLLALADALIQSDRGPPSLVDLTA